MSTAEALHEHITDRVLDTEEAIEVVKADPLGAEVASEIVGWLHSAAAADGVTPEEARAVAKRITAAAYDAFLASNAARAIGEAAAKVVARITKAGLHGGLSRREARRVERIRRAHIDGRRSLRAAERSARGDASGGA